MGKKNKNRSDLGKSLIKDRFKGRSGKITGDKSMLHTTELQDGYDWGRLNLQSVTEESSFQEFLSTAELAGTEFQAEKLNITFVNPRCNVGLLSDSEKQSKNIAHEKHKHLVQIPRRPQWTSTMSAEDLQLMERENFLRWRRSLAELQEEEGLLLTPFEKNIEFWRQLWRVIEKSDVVVQIVDARNPLLFRCEDLEKYVKEVSEEKINVILINKADFLTEKQRQFWTKYFQDIGMRIVFFSAISENKKVDLNEISEETEEKVGFETIKANVKKLEEDVERTAERLSQIASNIIENVESVPNKTILNENKTSNSHNIYNFSEILSREKLIDFFKTIHSGKKVTPGLTTVGMVGYPNVGKSSTINNLMIVKKVSVSATPGKTKHFQTLFLEKDILLCDCPGLVMPSFVYTKAEMIINGILPIDQMRDHVPPINLVCSLIPRHILEDKYGLMLPKPMEGEDPDRPPFAEELLNAYGYNRGFMTANGQPDNPRSARYILKDFVSGKLLYAHAPSNVDQNEYQTWQEKRKTGSENRIVPPRQSRAIRPNRVTSEDIDKAFFSAKSNGVHIKGKKSYNSVSSAVATSGAASQESLIIEEKPWKKINKHENKKKREKLRRVYAHLDEH